MNIRFLVLFVFVSCLERIEFTSPDPNQQIVVDGSITDDPGPYQVRLFNAIGVGGILSEAHALINSTVTLFDDAGNSEIFGEISRGVYQTAGVMRGQVGRTYHIEITTAEGKKYQSAPEKMLPVGPVDSVYFSFEHKDVVVSQGVIEPLDGFNIYFDSHALAGAGNLLRWKWMGTYEVLAFPQDHTKWVPGAGNVRDPLPCSGYILDENGQLKPNGSCDCCTCWAKQIEDIPFVSDDQLVSSEQFKRVNIAFIPIDGNIFYKKYWIEVQQMSMTPTAYLFWKIVRAQKLGSSNLFQPPASVVQGNITSMDGNGEQPLGIFYASSIQRKGTFIKHDDVPYPLPITNPINDTCLSLYESTTTQPSFW